MIFGLRTSDWIYDTGATGGSGLGFLLASGGTIYLKDPTGKEEQFYYGGVGLGLGRMIGIPKIPDISLPKNLHIPHEPSATGAATSFTSTGGVYMTSAFRGKELKRSDLTGGTVYIDAGFGIIADGMSVSIILLGLNMAFLMMSVAMPQMPFFRAAVHEAPAVLVMAGFSVGMQSGALANGKIRAGIGGGAGLMLGHLQ
ncbi:hypothetical protein [Burkholderia pseudomallei]|uniref:hypothetical protein n=1 Tax=Burkholderia pseudomallei TaxID=28450 RepID=UPI0021F6E51C|nr:hypothetical protein [Burkholderia pseudomallei]MCW0082679.1 hypothetical protein [Burkholderia pseudomallei]